MSTQALISMNERGCNEPPSALERALLPWEATTEFRNLRAQFHLEHAPDGPTQAGIVDQLVWIEWRRRRLVIGERAAHMAALQDRLSAPHKTSETINRAMITSGEKAEKEELAPTLATLEPDDRESRADADEDEAMTLRAAALLETGDSQSYGEALAALRQDTRDWWEDMVSDDEQTHPDGLPKDGENYRPYARTREQLLRFINTEVMRHFRSTRAALERRPAIRLQAHGESVDPFRMDRILALDERLTRQFEKTLGMLLRLKELRSVSKGASRE